MLSVNRHGIADAGHDVFKDVPKIIVKCVAISDKEFSPSLFNLNQGEFVFNKLLFLPYFFAAPARLATVLPLIFRLPPMLSSPV